MELENTPAASEIAAPESAGITDLASLEAAAAKMGVGAAETPAPVVDAAAKGEPAKAVDGKPAIVAATPAAPAYTPNFKYKVSHQGVGVNTEKEIPEQFRALIKDAATEKMVREVFEKADGIDVVKQSRAEVQKKLQTVETEHSTLLGSLNTMSDFVNRGDLDSFFTALNIPEQTVLKWAYEKATLSDLSPEQKAQYDRQQAAQREAYWAQQQSSQYESQLQTLQTQQRQTEFSMYLQSPEITSIMQAYDQRKGPNSFRQDVKDLALEFHEAYGKDLTVPEAVGMLMKRVGAFIQPGQQQPEPAMIPAPQGNTSQAASGQAPKIVPIIPTPQGSSGASPAKKTVTSLEDIEKEANAYFAQTRVNE